MMFAEYQSFDLATEEKKNREILGNLLEKLI